jgi:hypothetical protein
VIRITHRILHQPVKKKNSTGLRSQFGDEFWLAAFFFPYPLTSFKLESRSNDGLLVADLHIEQVDTFQADKNGKPCQQMPGKTEPFNFLTFLLSLIAPFVLSICPSDLFEFRIKRFISTGSIG